MISADAAAAGRRATGGRQEGLLCATDDEFLEPATQFIRDGLAREEAVLTVVDEPKIRAIRAALNRDADRASFADMGRVGRNTALITQAWRDFVSEHAPPGRAVRGIGEPISPSRNP